MTLADLDALAFQYRQLPVLQQIGVFYALVVLGGVLGGLWRSTASLTRSQYFACMAALSFGLAVNHGWWLAYPAALRAGYGFFPAVAEVLGTLAGGALLTRLAMARSNDGYGASNRAWQAFAPAMGLAPIFFPRNRAAGSILAGLPLFLAGAVLLVLARLAAPMIETETARRMNALSIDPALSLTFQTTALRAMGVEAALDEVVAGTPTPTEIEGGITLDHLFRDGTQLTYVFLVAKDGGQGTTDHDIVARQYCLLMLPYLTIGADVVMRFGTSDGTVTDKVALSTATCTG